MTLLPPVRLDTQKKYRALVDADLLLELMHNRSPFVEEAEYLFGELRKYGDIELSITDKAIKRIAIEHEDLSTGLQVAQYFHQRFSNNIIRIDSALKDRAQRLGFPDSDSGVEYLCAKEQGFDAIITQNPSNYPGKAVQIWSVSELSHRLTLENSLTLSTIDNLAKAPSKEDSQETVLSHISLEIIKTNLRPSQQLFSIEYTTTTRLLATVFTIAARAVIVASIKHL